MIGELHKIQEKEGLHLGNKLKTTHIQWKRQKMKVNIAVQTLSASVADAIEFCDHVLKLSEFSDCAATVKFIRMFYRLFDILNSCNSLGNGYKSALRKSNEKVQNNILF